MNPKTDDEMIELLDNYRKGIHAMKETINKIILAKDDKFIFQSLFKSLENTESIINDEIKQHVFNKWELEHNG